MRILITGATGFIGSHLVKSLIEKGDEVIACVRKPTVQMDTESNIEYLQVNFTTDNEIAIWLPRLEGVDIVINTVGIIRESGEQSFYALHNSTPCALFRACEISDVKKVIQVSALGADESAISEYHLSKKAADDLLSKTKLDWTILMPSIVYGPRAKSMAFFKALSSLPVIPIVGLGDQPIQPIHINDVIHSVQQIIESNTPSQKRIELAGPEQITMRELYAKLRKWLHLSKPHFLSIPYTVSLYLARWSGFLGSTPINEAAEDMLRQGNTGKRDHYTEVFGHTPISFDQVLAETPAQESDQWHAGLYILRPFLRISIAFVWLFTGIISAFVIPVETSYAMMAKAGIGGILSPIILYGASVVDVLLGIAILFRLQPVLMCNLQILIILLYTAIITVSQPDQWLHPFGPVSKNFPLIISILILTVMEKRK